MHACVCICFCVCDEFLLQQSGKYETHTHNGILTLAAKKKNTNSLVAGHADNCLGDFFQDKPLLMLKPPRAACNYMEEVVLEGAAHFLREDTPPVLYCVIVQLEAEVAHRIWEAGGGEAARDKNAESVVVFYAFANGVRFHAAFLGFHRIMQHFQRACCLLHLHIILFSSQTWNNTTSFMFPD